MRQAYLRNADAQSDRGHWYSLHLQPTLFGGVDLVRRWGRIVAGAQGQEARTAFPDAQAAESELSRLVQQRLRRGYALSSAGEAF